jgi:hypothetical protein
VHVGVTLVKKKEEQVAQLITAIESVVIARTLRVVAAPEDRFSRIIFCRIRSGFICRIIQIIVICLVLVGPPSIAFDPAKPMDRLPVPGLFQRPASTSRAVRDSSVHPALPEKFGKVTWGVCFSRPRRRPSSSSSSSSSDSTSFGFEDEDEGRRTRTIGTIVERVPQKG